MTAEELNNIAKEHYQHDRYPKANAAATEALTLARAAGDNKEEAKALHTLGIVANYTGAYPAAEAYFRQALALYEALGNKSGAARVTGNIGIVYKNLSDYPRALEYYGKALAAHEALGDKSGAARVTGNIGIVYMNLSDYPRALEYYGKALAAHEALGENSVAARVTGNIGNVYGYLSDYPRALEYLGKALAAHEALGEKSGAARVTGNIGNVYLNLSDYSRALEYYGKALAAHEALGEKSGAARVTGNIGIVYKNLSDYPRALEYLGKALAAHEALGEKNGAAIVTFNIGNVYNNLSDYSRALEYFGKTLSAFEELGNRRSATLAIGNIGAVYAKQDFDGYDATKAEEYLLKAVAISSEIGTKLEQYEFHKSLVDLYKQQQRWEECQSHFEKYHGLKEEVQSEEARKKAELMEQRRQADEREKQLAVERARAQATEELLHNTLPPEIADRLLAGERIADAHANVSVLFADIVDFTRLSQTLTAKELVEGLDFLFTKFDDLVEKHGLEKIKTIGDCYMAIAGAPAVRADHAEAIAAMALEMMAVAATFRAISTGEPIRLRIGLHSGEVVAGVIGRRKYTYDLWGDAVNTAARMESHGEAGKIHCSGEFVRAVGAVDDLPLHLRFVERGEMDIKGKGTMTTYFLERA
jgi:adenylate cyclase